MKNLEFLHVFGSRGLPREPQETQEGSQKVPRELQNLPKKKSKNRPQKSRVLERFWVRFGGHFGGQKWTKKEPKKNPKNDPKNNPKKAPRMRPKTAQDSPKSGSSGPVSSQVVHTQSHMYAKKVVNVKPPRYLKVSLSAIYCNQRSPETTQLTLVFEATRLTVASVIPQNT